MSSGSFRITLTRPDDGVVVVSVTGEVDLCSSISLREQLNRALDEETRTLIVDAAQVPFMDSAGLGCLVAAARRALAAGCPLILVARDRVRRILTFAGIDQVVQVCGSLSEAMTLSTRTS